MWKRLSQKQIFTHPRITLIEDEVQLPDGSVTHYLTFAHTGDSMTIICQKDGKILISQEYAYPTGEVLWQFPGGKLEQNEDLLTAARRELKEETGYVASDLTQLGWYYTNNRRSKSKMYVFLAANPEAGEMRGGDAEEDINSMWVSEAKVIQMIKEGEIVNYSVLAAWALYITR